jgi:hypothetical protein
VLGQRRLRSAARGVVVTYRSVLGPLFEYMEPVKSQVPHGVVTIVEFVPRHWWQQALHNQTELLVKGALLFRPGIMVVDVPSHLKV